MAKLTGKIIYVYPTQQLTSKSGNAFTKRDFVLAVQSFDRDTGEPTIDEDNTPLLTLTGDRCSQLDNIAPGQIVTVDFYLRGRRYRDEQNKEKILTDINVTSVRAQGQAIQRPSNSSISAPTQDAQASTETPQSAGPPKDPSDDLPF
ncbi:MAG: DUF3127 domain-containing protein [Muribaculaceae bacterium]|nr:DUF3127 domain-containing protein [Muribaculaceae bacterium]